MQLRQCTIFSLATALFTYKSIAAPSWGQSGSPMNTSSNAISTPTTPMSISSSNAMNLLTSLSKTQQILLSDTYADVYNLVLTDDRQDFVFDFGAKKATNPVGQGGEIVTANRKTFPALTNQNIGMAVGFIKPCGFNTPHIHNRATELLIVTKGKLISEMVIENGVLDANVKPRNIINTIEEYQMTPFFQGAIHTQYNPTCEDVIFVAPLSSDDFGASQIANNVISLENEILRAVFSNTIDGAVVDKFKDEVSVNVALGVEQCLETCGIAKRM